MNGTNLYIQKFKHRRKQESNEGIYQCIATNEAGSLASKPARLSKAGKKNLIVHSERQNGWAEESATQKRGGGA